MTIKVKKRNFLKKKKIKEIKKELEELTGFPCVIGNDANVAALGEMWKGAGEGDFRSGMFSGGSAPCGDHCPV